MEQILISVETIQQRDKVVEVLDNEAEAVVGGELDFPFDVWKLHRSAPWGRFDLCPRPTHP